MLIDSIQLQEGSTITNLVVASGTSFPSQPDLGELFFHITNDKLYCYTGTWDSVLTESQSGVITIAGDVTGSGAGTINVTLTNNSVSNVKLALMASHTIKGNNTAGTSAPSDLTPTQVKAILQITASDISGLSAVATSNAYADLSGKPTLATVATSGSYTDLINKPTISTVGSSGSYADLLNKPTFATVATSGLYSDLLSKPTLSTVAGTGSYNDLINKPALVAIATSGSASDLTTGTVPDARIAQSSVTQYQAALSILESQIQDGTILARVAGNETVTGNWSFTQPVTGVDPTLGTQLATKQYVDSIASGISPKASVKVATDSNVTLAGLQTIDGVTLVAGNRVLVMGQTNAANNGVYVAASGAWTRAGDFDGTPSIEVATGDFVYVELGTNHGGEGWVLTTQGAITVGTTALTFSQITSALTGVASVDVSGGSTGLSFSGGPVTTTGTLTMNGTLAISAGGTGATTATAAVTNLLPSQSGNTGKFLKTDSAVTSWAAISSSDVTTALGYVPYNVSNPAGYTGNVGTVTSVSVVTAHGISGTVATSTVTPAITLTLGDITPSSIVATGAISGSNLSGTNTGDETITTIKTKLGVSTLSGANTGDQTISLTGDVTGSGTGSFAATLSTTGVTPGDYTKVTVDTKGRVTFGTQLVAGDIPNLAATYQPLSNELTAIANISATTGYIKKTGIGTYQLDTNVYLTANQTVTISGDISGSGTTAITLTLPNIASAGTYKSVTVNAKGQVTAGTNPTTLSGYGITDAINTSQLGANSGVATLDSTGKLTNSQIPTSLIGSLNYQGTWNATTNSPAITSSVGTKGYYYVVGVAGSTTINGNTNWTVGDVISFNGSTWDQIQGGTSDVSSVFGRVGAVTLQGTDVTTALGYTPYNSSNPSAYITSAQAPVQTVAGRAGAVVLTSSDVGLGNVSNIAQLPNTQTLAITGDVVATATALNGGTIATSLATITQGSAGTSFVKVALDTKGRVTNNAAVTASDITTALGATYVQNATHATSADGVTTNANLTGVVTSVGNATSIAAGAITNTMLANGAVANLSGTNTGDETLATIKSKLGITTLSGSNTGDQTITLTGDVTGSGTGSFAATLATVATAGTYRSVTINAKGLVTAGTNPTTLAGYGITDAVNTSLVGAASGLATLDATGKLTTAQIPASLVGGMVYQGTWNASTNTPTLVAGTGTKGNYYKVSVAGTTSIDGNANWTVGDIIVFDGTTWDIVQGGTSDVSSVFGRVGAVTLLSSDVTTALGFTPYNSTNPSGYTTNVGTVTSVSVVSANGFAGTVATSTVTPAITLTTSISGMLKGSSNALVAATAGTDYSAGTAALGTGILKSTTSTGALTIAVAADFPTLNQSTTGNAATATSIAGGATGQLHYQSAASTTAFATTAAYGVITTNGSSVPAAIAGAAGVLQGSTSAVPVWTTAPTLTGTNFSAIPNAALSNSNVTIGSTAIALGNSSLTLAGLTSVSATTFTGALTGNVTGTASNATLAAAATTATITNDVATNATYYPTFVTANTGNMGLETSSTKLTYNPGTGTLSATVFSGSGGSLTNIPNTALTNSSITLGSTAVALGGTTATLTGLTSVSATTFTGSLSGTASLATAIAGGAANQLHYQTAAGVTSFVTTANYGVVTTTAAGVPVVTAGAAGVLVGSASAIPAWTTAPALTGTNFTGIPNGALTNSSITINGTAVSLGGTATVTAAAGTLTGTSLPATVTGSSLTSVGSLASLNVAGAATVQNLTVATAGTNSSSAFDTVSLTTTTTTANQVVDATVPISSTRVAKYYITATSGTSYHYTEVTIMHDGATAYVNEINTMFTGASLATFDADITGGLIRLLVSPVNAATTVKALCMTIAI